MQGALSCRSPSVQTPLEGGHDHDEWTQEADLFDMCYVTMCLTPSYVMQEGSENAATGSDASTLSCLPIGLA